MSRSLNSVNLSGRLTRDPEIRQAQNGTYIAKFSMAIDDSAPDGQGGYKDDPTFVDVTMFGKAAESAQRHLRKASLIIIQNGRIKQDRWEDRETGQKRSKVYVVAHTWLFAGSKPEGQAQNGGFPQQQQQQGSFPQQGQAPASFPGVGGGGSMPPASNFGGGPNTPDDDCPF